VPEQHGFDGRTSTSRIGLLHAPRAQRTSRACAPHVGRVVCWHHVLKRYIHQRGNTALFGSHHGGSLSLSHDALRDHLPVVTLFFSRLALSPSPLGNALSCYCLGHLPCCSSGVCVYRWAPMPRTAQARAMSWIEPSAAMGSCARMRSRKALRRSSERDMV
jgi:hypothetical protein